jgi:hypothetical protein
LGNLLQAAARNGETFWQGTDTRGHGLMNLKRKLHREKILAGPTWEGATKLPAAPETRACVESKKQHGYMRTIITARGNTCRDRFFSLDDVERETFRLLSGRRSRGG